MCINNFFWECAKCISTCIIAFNNNINYCSKNTYYIINKNTDYITIYNNDKTFYVDMSNEYLLIQNLNNLYKYRVNYLFPIINVVINNNDYNLQIQESGKYFDLIGNVINKNMIETILNIKIYSDYELYIIDSNMNKHQIKNGKILLNKDNYEII